MMHYDNFGDICEACRIFTTTILLSLPLSTLAASDADSFQFPISTPWNQSLHFGTFVKKPTSSFSRCGFHLADDIPASARTEIVAAANGKVVFEQDILGLGHSVVVEHRLPDARRVTTVYHHLKRESEGGTRLSVGQDVTLGQRLGEVTGNSLDNGTGPHLHFGVRNEPFRGDSAGNPDRDSRTKRWFYPGYSNIYDAIGDKTPQCDPNDSTHNAVVADWCQPDTFIKHQHCLTVYDNFDTGTIDFQGRWSIGQQGGTARNVLDGQLHLAADFFGNVGSNTGAQFDGAFLGFRNPDNIEAMEATVVVSDVFASACPGNPDSGGARFGMQGNFFNVASPTNGSQVDDLRVEMRLLHTPNDPTGTLSVSAFVHICTNVNCSTIRNGQLIALGTASLGDEVRLQLIWDRNNKRFIFRRDNQGEVFVPYVFPDSAMPGARSKGFFVAAFPPNCASGPRPRASMDALIDNVFVNDSAVPVP